VNPPSATYIGLSKDAWELLFSAFQALVLVFGIAFALFQLRDLVRQRSLASLEKMFEEWRAGESDRDVVLRSMPVFNGAVEARCVHLATQLLSESAGGTPIAMLLGGALIAARATVHQLNDLGAFLDRGSVRQVDVFGQYHTHIMELVYLLEPYFLLVTICRGDRWGMRLRRLRSGAEVYHLNSPLHKSRTLRLRGEIVFSPVGTARPTARRSRSRRLMPSPASCIDADDAALRSVSEAIADAQVDLVSLGRLIAIG
jgi:hypothetical protein